MKTFFKTIALTLIISTAAQEALAHPHTICCTPPSPLTVRRATDPEENGPQYVDEELDSPFQVQDSAPQSPAGDVEESGAEQSPAATINGPIEVIVDPMYQPHMKKAENLYRWIETLTRIIALRGQLETTENWMEELPRHLNAVEISRDFFDLFLAIEGLLPYEFSMPSVQRIYVNACMVYIYNHIIELEQKLTQENSVAEKELIRKKRVQRLRELESLKYLNHKLDTKEAHMSARIAAWDDE